MTELGSRTNFDPEKKLILWSKNLSFGNQQFKFVPETIYLFLSVYKILHDIFLSTSYV